MKIHKHPFFLSPNSSPPTPSPACSSSSPFTLCALTSLTMRVIGISKCWRGQKGTQHHPENLIGECLEAQHSKGESLLNYIYISISIYAYLHITSFILALLAFFFLFQRPLITIWESNTNIFHSHITIFLTFCPSLFQRLLFFFSYLHFSHPTFSLMFCFFYLFIGRFMKFIYVLTFFNLEL